MHSPAVRIRTALSSNSYSGAGLAWEIPNGGPSAVRRQRNAGNGEPGPWACPECKRGKIHSHSANLGLIACRTPKANRKTGLSQPS